ncbi:DUF6686 family protein [Mucilaginibacter sp. L196]|uniref:DUF6686 family protein n=1 Tax=Mucilaginibacter sp. L196 TaxID=1641870 RepID=UPI00131B641E
MCKTIVLSRKCATVISQCMECKIMNIWLRNLLLNFTPEQFKMFKNFTSGLDVEESMFPFPDGEDRLVLRTPHSDICFTFSLTEWEDFQAAMEEAEYMQGVYTLISP